MKKKLLVVLVVLLVLLAASLTVFVLTLDSSIRKAVEEGGSYALKVPVGVEKVSLSLTEGRVSLQGFSVANPEGFKTPTAVSLQEISAQIRLSSLAGEVIEVPEIVLRGPKLTIETRLLGLKGSNIRKLLDNLDETLAEHAGPGGKPKEKPAGGERRYRVGRILVTGATLALADTVVTRGRESAVTVREIELTGLSTEMTLAEIIEKSLRAIVRAAAKSPGRVGELAAKLTARSGRGLVEGALKGAGEIGKGGLKGAGEVVKGGARGVGEVVKGVGKGLGEIGKGIGKAFKGKKKDEEKKR